ncbi:MAG TPA: DUF3244 domain-containing protein [Bacteroides togonis]|nr:DUF3244 domain-containing protein [Bacteroides togonis]
MKKLFVAFVLVILCISTYAHEKLIQLIRVDNIEDKTTWEKEKRSVIPIFTVTHNNNVITIASDTSLDHVKVTIKDDNNNILHQSILTTSSTPEVLIMPNDIKGYYIIDIAFQGIVYQGFIIF